MRSQTKRVTHEINGREYRIEVRSLSASKWRAQVVTSYGGPTALMPFYGATAEAATSKLEAWLARAHRSSESA